MGIKYDHGIWAALAKCAGINLRSESIVRIEIDIT